MKSTVIDLRRGDRLSIPRLAMQYGLPKCTVFTVKNMACLGSRVVLLNDRTPEMTDISALWLDKMLTHGDANIVT